MPKLTLELSLELHQKLKELAVKYQMTRARFITAVLADFTRAPHALQVSAIDMPPPEQPTPLRTFTPPPTAPRVQSQHLPLAATVEEMEYERRCRAMGGLPARRLPED